jgi:hypothetical protein
LLLGDREVHGLLIVFFLTKKSLIIKGCE